MSYNTPPWEDVEPAIDESPVKSPKIYEARLRRIDAEMQKAINAIKSNYQALEEIYEEIEWDFDSVSEYWQDDHEILQYIVQKIHEETQFAIDDIVDAQYRLPSI